MFDIRLPRGERSFDAPSTFFRRDGGKKANRLGKIAVMEEFERWKLERGGEKMWGMGREKRWENESGGGRGERKISNGIKDERGRGLRKWVGNVARGNI